MTMTLRACWKDSEPVLKVQAFEDGVQGGRHIIVGIEKVEGLEDQPKE